METIKNEYPILEYDPHSKPIIEAKKLYASKSKDCIKKCLITYFQDVVEQYERDDKINQIFRLRTEGVRPRVYEMVMEDGEVIYIIPVPLGAPIAARMIESMHAMGATKFMVCGGAGTLNDKLTRDYTLVPVAAVRDEGTSYHYLPPSREIEINQKVLAKIEETLEGLGEKYLKVKTWTTDASFRETENKVALRKEEGCETVEMECSAYYSVAKHLGIECGQLLYAGDIVKACGWEYRNWHSKTDIRVKLFELAIKCLVVL